MRTRLVEPVLASSLARELGLRLRGADASIELVAPLSSAPEGSLVFCTRAQMDRPSRPVCVIGGPDLEAESLIVSDAPRLDFARALDALEHLSGFGRADAPPDIHPTASIGEYVSIGCDVVIGEGTTVEPFVRIADDVTIGAHCWIRSGAVIGEAGFGFERDAEGVPHRLLHLGGVEIGDRVEVGSLATVNQGMLVPTIIEDDVKIGDHVHIAHNCWIERSVMIATSAALSGSVRIGARSWVGPNTSIRDGLHVSEEALIGIGSNVVAAVQAGVTVAGNPARERGLR